jgi:hypothetical protein
MRKTSSALILLACLLTLAQTEARAQAAGAPASIADSFKPEPLFAELRLLPSPESLSDLERIDLAVSGVSEPDRIAAYEAKLDSIFAGLKSEADSIADPSAKAEAVLSYLHKTSFKAYREDATTLDGVLDTGIFNCVSSALLYALAAKSLGIEVAAVRTSDHAFCSVRIGDRSIDVETTNPYGFDPGNKKEFKDSFGRATGYAYVAPGAYGDRRDITLRELAGLVLSNRASALERSGRYAQAVKVGADYAAILPGEETSAFLSDRVNNLVASFEARRDYAGAEAAALAAAAALPEDGRVASLAAQASYNRAAALAQAGDWAGAFDRAAVLLASPGSGADKASRDALAELMRSSLSALGRALAQKGDFEGARRAVADRTATASAQAAKEAYAEIGDIELVRAANGMAFAQAQATADRLLSAGQASASRYAEATAAIYGKEAARIGKAGDFLGAAKVAEDGIAKLDAATLGVKLDPAAKSAQAPRANLVQIADAMRHNFVAQAHNRFAARYNAGDYAGAEAIMNEALAAMPGDPTLAKDLETARAARKQ